MLQEIQEDDFIPQLAFAFYKHSSSNDTPITSHKVNLKSITQNQSQNMELIKIDDDNKIAIRVENEGNLMKVTIVSEVMVADIKKVCVLDGPVISPTPKNDVSLATSQAEFTSTTVYEMDISEFDIFIFSSGSVLSSQIKLSGIRCSLEPEFHKASVPARDKLTFSIDDIQIDNCLRDQTYDYPVVMFTDKAVRTHSTSNYHSDPFVQVKVIFNNSQNTSKHSVKEFSFQMGKIHVHLEDVFLYKMKDVVSHFLSRYNNGRAALTENHVTPQSDHVSPQSDHVTPHTDDVKLGGTSYITPLPGNYGESSRDIPHVVTSLMSELYEPLTAELFSISDIDIGLWGMFFNINHRG